MILYRITYSFSKYSSACKKIEYGLSLQEASRFFLLPLIPAIVWQIIIDPVQVCSVGSKVSGILLLPSRGFTAHQNAHTCRYNWHAEMYKCLWREYRT